MPRPTGVERQSDIPCIVPPISPPVPGALWTETGITSLKHRPGICKYPPNTLLSNYSPLSCHKSWHSPNWGAFFTIKQSGPSRPLFLHLTQKTIHKVPRPSSLQARLSEVEAALDEPTLQFSIQWNCIYHSLWLFSLASPTPYWGWGPSGWSATPIVPHAGEMATFMERIQKSAAQMVTVVWVAQKVFMTSTVHRNGVACK